MYNCFATSRKESKMSEKNLQELVQESTKMTIIHIELKKSITYKIGKEAETVLKHLRSLQHYCGYYTVHVWKEKTYIDRKKTFKIYSCTTCSQVKVVDENGQEFLL